MNLAAIIARLGTHDPRPSCPESTVAGPGAPTSGAVTTPSPSSHRDLERRRPSPLSPISTSHWARHQASTTALGTPHTAATEVNDIPTHPSRLISNLRTASGGGPRPRLAFANARCIPLNKPEELDAAGTNRAAVAGAIMHTYAQMMFQSDRFHADPHPGNLIARPDKRLGVVDFGEVGYINDETRNALVRLLVAVLGRDSAALGQAVLAVSRSTRAVDRRGLGPDLATLLQPITDTTLQDIKLGAVLRDLLPVLRRYGLVLPADLAILLKTVIECEGTMNELDPAFGMNNFLAELGKRVAVVNTDRDPSAP